VAQRPGAGATEATAIPTRDAVRYALALALGSFAIVWVILQAKSFVTLQ